MLFQALKSTYEFLGASAEYYACLEYDNAKISDYDSLGDFITGLMNLAHLMNREIQGSVGRISERHIAMKVIHSLPSSMRTLQTILLKTAPDSSTAIWDLSVLKSHITADERRVRAAGENLGTKLDASHQSNALMAETRAQKVGCRDPNDPTWLSHQMCWWCGKVGHIRQKCTASQGEKEAYRVAKAKGAANANAASDESDTYARALVAEEILHVDAAPTISSDTAK